MLDEEQLKELENFSGLMFTITEIAILLEVNQYELKLCLNDKNSIEFKKYQKGKLLTQAELRRTQIKMAKQGSTPAFKHVMELWELQTIKEI